MRLVAVLGQPLQIGCFTALLKGLSPPFFTLVPSDGEIAMFASETAPDGARSGHADIQLEKLRARFGGAKAASPITEADEGRLIGHYIEDDALDALALTGMLNGEGEISLTTSTTLNDFEDWIEGGDLDFVLVDIYRPDSRSFEDEVKRIRAHSNASIFFITGDEAKFYVDDAVDAGAEGILEKEALTADGLLKVLRKAVRARPARPNRADFIATSAITKGSERGWDTVRRAEGNCPQNHAEGNSDGLALPLERGSNSIDPKRFEVAQHYLNDALKALADGGGDARSLREILGAVADAQILLMAFAQNQADCAAAASRSTPRAIHDLQRAALSTAKQRGIKLAFHTAASVFDGANSRQANLCIRSFLKAVIIGSPRGGTIKFNGLRNADGIRLSITSTAKLPFDIDDVIDRKLIIGDNNLPSSILMTALCMLLDLYHSKITVFRRENLNTIIIDIQDG